MTDDHIRKGRNYEFLIRKVYNCEKGRRFGADSNLLIELYKLELEDNKSIRYRRRFEKVKMYIQKATGKLMKKKKYIRSRWVFGELSTVIYHAQKADDLSKIVNKTLIKIMECEDELRKVSRESVRHE